jgi:hypothetical protein
MLGNQRPELGSASVSHGNTRSNARLGGTITMFELDALAGGPRTLRR